ncbi:MAG TPA: hypothetical protein VGN82_11215 [Bosea sp. (in: a-proteobacteria)]|uniref:hypothetical protein n=1 Tax=Bosea sp. (in: a-proteobacteria) TaxID=1871050 RepID=UPI002E0DB46E|nr:hypothetical protein [Bosea sp. (in: a-proteobacteria)]
MLDQDANKPEAASAPIATPAADCDVAEVTRRAKAGLVTIVVAVVVAVVTLAGAAATLLVTGLVPLSGLEGRIAHAIEERLGRDWTVEAAAAELGRIDGHSQLRVRQVSFRHKSGAAIRAPEAILGYEPMALLRGEIRLTSVDLRGVNVRLGVNKDGALIVNADSAPAETRPPSTLPDAAQWNAFTGIMAAVSTLGQGDGLLGALETAGMNGARLLLVDPDGRQRASLEDVEIRLARTGERGTRLTAKGRTGQRWKELAIDLSSAADGTQRADIDIVRFEPAEAVALAMGTGGLAIEGLPVRGKASLSQAPDGRKSIEARLEVLPGTIRFPDSPVPPIAVDAAHVEIASSGDLSTIEVRSFGLNAGATRLNGTGSLRADGSAWRSGLEAKGQLAGVDADPPVAIDALKAELRIDPGSSEVRIDTMSVQGPGIRAEGRGLVQQVGGSPLQRFSIVATDSDPRAALALWPRWTSPDVHGTLSRQFISGRLASLRVDMDLAAEDHARLMQGAGIPDNALSVVVDASQVRFLPGPGLPPLIDASVSGRTTGRTVKLAISKATADLGNGRQLQLSEGSFDIAETWVKRTPARAAFRTTGSMEALTALFGFPALKEFSPGGIDPASLRGNSDLKSTVNLALVDDPQPGEIVVTSTGTLTGVASDTLLGTEKLDSGNLTVNADRNGLQLRGEARVGGDKAQVEIRQDARGKGEANLTLTLDNAARQKRGLGPEAGINGPVQVRVTKALGKGADLPPRVESDLTKASLEGAMPGLSKPAGRPAKLTFNYLADPDGPDLDDLVFDSNPVLIRGKVELNRQNGFESASLSQFRLSAGDNLKVDAKRDGNVMKLVVRGAVADVRPFIRDIQQASGPSAPRGDKQAGRGGDIDLDLDVPILTGFNNEAITNATLKLSKRGGDMRSVAFQGRIGRADVTAKQTSGAGALLVQSENGGALLRFVDLYRRAHGGDLILNLGPGETRQSGELLFRNFVVRDEPALQRVVGEHAAQALSADRSDNSAARAPINVNEVAFIKLRAEFTRSASRLDISDMVIWGQQVGFTLQGNVDYGRDRVDIGGTFVPGYAFNNAFAQVPVVGALLGGGSQYGGLFAVNFRIAGTASAPTMTINPLSAIAPGILRRFVDPLGGSPAHRPIQPGQPVPGR